MITQDSILRQLITISESEENPKEGDYVFVSNYCDADPNDPWYVGTLKDIHSGNRIYYEINESKRFNTKS